MAHSLIVGMTESGKTSLAKKLAADYRKAGIQVLVLDPIADPEWQANYRTDNANEFLRVVKGSRSCAIFIDEAGETIGRYEDDMFWLATRGRHYGHSCHFLAQRANQIAKTVRDQCSMLYMFASSRDDSKTLATEFNDDRLSDGNRLLQGEFYKVGRFAPARKYLIDFETRSILELDKGEKTDD